MFLRFDAAAGGGADAIRSNSSIPAMTLRCASAETQGLPAANHSSVLKKM
jgi:hypothetical protein